MLERLERRIGATGNGTPAAELDASSVGRLSRIEALQNQELTRKLQDRERAQLDEVLQALERLNAGTYGLCTACNGAIAPERLLVFPETRSCGDCPGS